MRRPSYVWPDRSCPDWRAARADLRAASCLASGVDLHDIDPRQGFDISRRAYESVRSQWQGLLTTDADNQWTQQSYRQVRAMWLAYRPEWNDDWQLQERLDTAEGRLATAREQFELERVAALIDPEAWRHIEPHSAEFFEEMGARAQYEANFAEAVRQRREPSLAAAERVITLFEDSRALGLGEEPSDV